MKKGQEMICFDEMRFTMLQLNYREKSLTELYEILYREGKGINIKTLFDDEYGKPFALYPAMRENMDSEAAMHEQHYITHDKCLGYSYGDSYNRNNRSGTLFPKVFFLGEEKRILQCNLFGQNIIVNLVPKKDIGRDSYYPNNYQYITQCSAVTIFQDILAQGKHKLFLGGPVRWDYRAMDPMETIRITEQFEAKTHFHGSFMYYPIQKVSADDILSDAFPIDEITKNCISKGENTISLQNLEQVREIRDNGIYKI